MSLMDYPGIISCIAFTPGCNFRCGYCHNPEFVLPEMIQNLRPSFIPESTLFNFLDQRKDLLEGVVVTGGEPTLMPDLLAFLEKIKSRGLLVKLDTNGNRPSVIKSVIENGLVDYIAMDVKTSLTNYKELVGPLASQEYLQESVDILRKNLVDYEFRSTLIKEVHTPEIISDMVKLLSGAKRLFLQKFRPENTLCAKFQDYRSFDDAELDMIRGQFMPAVQEVIIR